MLLFSLQYFAGGAGAEGEIAKYLEKNKTIVKLGYAFSVPSFRTKVDQYIMRNTDIGKYCTRGSNVILMGHFTFFLPLQEQTLLMQVHKSTASGFI